MTYNDDGNPSNYYFVVDDYNEPSHPAVYFTPVKYFKQEHCQSDWELNISVPWLSELAESTYEILWNVPGGPQTPQEAHDLLVAAGYVYNPTFASMAGIHGNSSIVTKTVKPKTAKLSTAFFKDYIQNVMVSDPQYGEIFEAYDDQPVEAASLRLAKNWKHSFKKKAIIKTIVDDANDPLTYDGIYGSASYALCRFYYGDHFYKKFDVKDWERSGKVFDAAYLSNENNIVVVREYWWTGNSDEDTTITFITNADDTEIVAICTHID